MRAPHEIPEWFQPAGVPLKPSPPPVLSLPVELFPDDFPDGVSKRNYILNLASSWRRDPCFSLADYLPVQEDLRVLVDRARPLLAAYEEAVNGFAEDVEEWQFAYDIQRVAEWPWAYADFVMAAEDMQR